MAQMRLALAQINPTVGDLDGNARAIREWTAKAAAAGIATFLSKPSTREQLLRALEGVLHPVRATK